MVMPHGFSLYTSLPAWAARIDEMIVWDAQEIWNYTQDEGANPAASHAITERKRNGRHNESNYRASVSVPK
jgi:hypothetical protein